MRRFTLFLTVLLRCVLAAKPAPTALAQDGTAGQREGTTAMLVSVRPDDHTELTAEGLWLDAEGRSLEVLAVEKGPVRVTVVRDPDVQPYLDRLARLFLEQRLDSIGGRAGEYLKGPRQEWDAQSLRNAGTLAADGTSFRKRKWQPSGAHLLAARGELMGLAPLGDGARIRFVSPLAAPVSRTVGSSNVFAISPPFAADRLLAAGRVGRLDLPRRYADAVLVAGRELSELRERRAVVLILGGDGEDASDSTPEQVRAELRRLQVPVVVWALASGELEAWPGGRLMAEEPPDVIDADDLDLFARSSLELGDRLDRQRIVRLAGRHELRDLRLSDQAHGICLVGRELR